MPLSRTKSLRANGRLAAERFDRLDVMGQTRLSGILRDGFALPQQETLVLDVLNSRIRPLTDILV